MRRLILAALLGATPILAPPALAASALQTVEGFYADPLLDLFDPGVEEELTEPALSVVRRNAETPEGEVGCIDFMPVVDGQDYDAEEIRRSIAFSEEEAGVVAASFTNFGDSRTILWTMREEEGVWRVADIESRTGDWKLSELCR